MAELVDYSTSAGSNNAASPNGYPENMAPSGLNNSNRETCARIKRDWSDKDGSVTTGGSSTAYTVTLNKGTTTLADIGPFTVELHTATGAAPTIAVNGGTAKNAAWADGTNLTTNDIASNTRVTFLYDADKDKFVVMSLPVNMVAAAASETVAGKAELATQAETNTGTDDARIVTPLKLTTWTPAVGTVTVARNDKVLLADTSASGILKQGLVSDFVTLVQRVYTSDAAVATGTTVMPDDDTIPQNTEGDQYMSLSITPTSASNRLRIYVKAYLSQSTGTHMTYALFQDTTANALTAGMYYNTTNGRILGPAILMYEMAAGTTSSTTFKFRAGDNTAGTTTFNGESGARLLGGVCNSVMIIEEIIP